MFRPVFTLKIENSKGQTFELSNNVGNYIVADVSGLTRPNTDINTSESSADGSYFNSAKLQSRNIVITLRLRGDIETNRQQLYTIFPMKDACTIYYRNKNRNVRIKGYVEVLDGSIFTDKEEMQISIICPNPYFEGLETIQTELTRIMKLFEFPFSIQEPIPISEIRALPFCTIINGGDVKCGCKIDISVSGNVKGLKIYNTTTQEMLGIDFDFQAGDNIKIDTTNTKKKCILVRDGAEISLLFYRVKGSSWFTLAQGANDFTFSVSEGEEYVKIEFAVVELYGGV